MWGGGGGGVGLPDLHAAGHTQEATPHTPLRQSCPFPFATTPVHSPEAAALGRAPSPTHKTNFGQCAYIVLYTI